MATIVTADVVRSLARAAEGAALAILRHQVGGSDLNGSTADAIEYAQSNLAHALKLIEKKD